MSEAASEVNRTRTAVASVARLFATRDYFGSQYQPLVPSVSTELGVGKRRLIDSLDVETITGRRFVVTVIASVAPGVPIPSWTVPVAFGDALANPDPRRWVALVQVERNSEIVFLAPEYAIQRIVMKRYLINARSGPRAGLRDAVVELDYGYDLAPVRGLFVSQEDLLVAVRIDALPGPSGTWISAS